MDSTSHIFICFSSKDEPMARKVVQAIEAEGLKCWISVRDVPPGHNYQEDIVHALEAATVIVFLFSENSRDSNEIRKELSLAGRLNAPVFPLRLSPVVPTGALRYELATRQWIDIFPDPVEAIRRLVQTIRMGLDAPAKPDETVAFPPIANPIAAPASPFTDTPAPAKKRSPRKRAPIVPAGSPEFESIRVLLARHIGPIAKIFVQKAATEARTPEDFCEKLAAHVTAPSDRAAFLQAARAQLAVKS